MQLIRGVGNTNPINICAFKEIYMKTNIKYIISFIIPLSLLFFIGYWYTHGTIQTNEFIVSTKERVANSESSKYLIFTDKVTFENTDSLFHLKFNSSDIYGNMILGECYKITYYGIRSHLMSMYPNIISSEPCE